MKSGSYVVIAVYSILAPVAMRHEIAGMFGVGQHHQHSLINMISSSVLSRTIDIT
jgi:hypothetical protein